MSKIKVIQYGFGAMGSGMIRMALHKKELEVVAGIARRNADEWSKKFGIPVSSDAAQVCKDTKADVLLHATASKMEDCVTQLTPVLEAGVNVITIAEEASYPVAYNQEAWDKLDAIAKKNNVSIMGVGINPGFMMDVVPIVMSSATTKVTKVRQERIVDYGRYGRIVWEHIGVGKDKENFDKCVASGEYPLHVGLEQTTKSVAEALGWTIDNYTETKEAIVSRIDRPTEFGTVQAGTVGGFKQLAQGFSNGKLMIEQVLVGLINPDEKEDGYVLGTKTWIEGDPTIEVLITGGLAIDGGKGTYARAVNVIPQFLAMKRPGFLKCTEIPISGCLLDK